MAAVSTLQIFTKPKALHPSADVLAKIEYVSCIVNGVHIIDLTPEHILAIPKLNGITPVTGELPLRFSEP